MKNIFSLFLILFALISLSAQEAQLATSEGNNLLVWPFADSYPITPQSGSNGWAMVNGAGGGLHKNSDYFAQDWLRPLVPTCGIEFKAPLSGTVIWIGNSMEGYGKQIIIQSNQDSSYAFRIAHLEAILVHRGQQIQVGDIIGKIGNTGNGPCHGHLVLYHKIYDRVFIPRTSSDSINLPTERAIDLLKKGLFISSPTPDITYFAASFSFLESEETLELIRFHPNTQELGNKDSLGVYLQLVNQTKKSQTGNLALTLQTEKDFNYYQGPTVEVGENVTIKAGDTLTTHIQKLFWGKAPGSYFLHLLFLQPDTVNGRPTDLDPITPIGRIPLEVYATDLCQRDEPNDQISTATALYPYTLNRQENRRTKEAYLSSPTDSKDIYTFTSQKLGRFELEVLGGALHHWQISDSNGEVETFRNGQTQYFYTYPNETYYLTYQGPSSCLKPYRFAYQWSPAKVLEWNFLSTDLLIHSFEVLEPVEVEWMIFDLLGRRLWYSGQQDLAKGNHQFKDQVALPQSGIYYIVLSIERRIAERRRFFWKGN